MICDLTWHNDPFFNTLEEPLWDSCFVCIGQTCEFLGKNVRLTNLKVRHYYTDKGEIRKSGYWHKFLNKMTNL